ncbi:MAG: response regulator transcription factor [Methylovirgula sp.]
MRRHNHCSEIFIADDDPSVREALSLVFRIEGYQVTCFSETASLYAAAHTRVPSCILLDVDMPERSGLDLLKELKGYDYPAPIIMISGKAQITMAVDAIKHGALDFIEKPFDPEVVALRVRRAVEGSAWRHDRDIEYNALPMRFPGAELLTRRECEVLARIAAGETSKAAGRHLGISLRTVDVHRARLMQKLHARNAADLMRIVLTEAHH